MWKSPGREEIMNTVRSVHVPAEIQTRHLRTTWVKFHFVLLCLVCDMRGYLCAFPSVPSKGRT